LHVTQKRNNYHILTNPISYFLFFKNPYFVSMFRQKYISFVVGMILLVGAIFGGAGFLLIEDAENFEKRELEEKLKESSISGTPKLSKFKSGSDDDHSQEVTYSSTLPMAFPALVLSPSSIYSFLCTSKVARFIRYCVLKIACSPLT